MECGQKCMENPYCRFWTYYLHDDAAAGDCVFFWTDVGMHKMKNLKANSGKQLCLGINVFGDEHNKLVKDMAYHTKWLNKGKVSDEINKPKPQKYERKNLHMMAHHYVKSS